MPRSSNEQYPSYDSASRRSNTSHPDDGFKDLHRQDFIHVAGHVSQRKLAILEVHPYSRALLNRGINHRVHEEVSSEDLRLRMEFSSAIGTMLMDEMVDINEAVSNRITVVEDRVQEALRDIIELWLALEEERRRVSVLDTEQEVLCRTIANLQQSLTAMSAVVRDLLLWWTMIQHGPENLIVIEEDDKSLVADSKVEIVEERDPPGYWDHHIVEEEEDLREAALEIEQVEEWEEFERRRIEGAVGIALEQLEAAQQAWLDLVPNYSVPPDYDE